MSDLISRQEALKAFDCSIGGVPVESVRYVFEYSDRMMSRINALPSAEPVKHEECEYIITKGKAGYHEEYKCSVCGDSFYWTQDRAIPRRFNYCRNCGRKIIRFIEKETEG